MSAFRRAIHDTFSGLIRPAVLGLLGFAIAFLGYVLILGWREAMAEFQVWWISVAGSVGAVFLLFVLNLACAPFRIERDARLALEAELGDERRKVAALTRGQSTARSISEAEAVRMQSLIQNKPRPKAINIVYAPGDQEAENFAVHLGGVFKLSGVDATVHCQPISPLDPSERGIIVRHGKNANLTTLAGALVNKLEAMGIAARSERAKEPDTFSIRVARLPRASAHEH